MTRTSANSSCDFRPERQTSGRCPVYTVLLTLLLLFNGSACGKIGPLSLPERPLPGAVADIVVEQRQNAIQLSWTFPEKLLDQVSACQPELISLVEIWHTTSSPEEKPFAKTAKRIKKISGKELTRNREKRFSMTFPFHSDQLDSVTHYFAISYRHQKQKSAMSRVIRHQAILPAQAVKDLSLSQEGRHLLLKWSRPGQNIVNKPLKELIGYNVYMRSQEGDKWSKDTLVNSDPVLSEGFDQPCPDLEGQYQFRITALSADRIESDFSNPVAITLTDKTAPQVPANLVCLSYDDHIILTWEGSDDADLDQYRIFRKQSHTEPFKILVEGIKTSFYRDYKVKRGQTYYYLVTAVDGRGNESSQSNLAEGKIE